jgi:hypothetical protein
MASYQERPVRMFEDPDSNDLYFYFYFAFRCNRQERVKFLQNSKSVCCLINFQLSVPTYVQVALRLVRQIDHASTIARFQGRIV